MNYTLRQKKFQQTLDEQRLDGFVVADPADLRYLCGYSGSNGLLLWLGGRRTFFTDGRYTQQAREEVQGARVVICKGPLMKDATRSIAKQAPAILGFEAGYTTIAAFEQMRNMVPKRIQWRPTSGYVMRQRVIKDGDELRLIEDAVNVGAAAYEQARRAIRPGVCESEVAGKLEHAARQAGAEGMSFETIVAAGRRAALPHGRASHVPIPRRGFVVVDSGVILRGYCSDLTRTVHVGRAGKQARQWYDAVLAAQLAAIATVAPGRKAAEVDQAARQVLRQAKLERYFTHSTGHGVGLEIHEPPRLGKLQDELLEPGMVITIEPGVYLPDQGGIRIEDMLVVTRTGSRILSPVTKELIEI